MPRLVFSMRVAVASAGGAALATITLTGADVVVLPAASRATAVNACDPSATVVVFQLIEYGEMVSATSTCTPSTKNVTAATPLSSSALALNGTVANTVVPLPGVVTDTDGAVVSGGASMMSNASTITTKSLDAAFLVRVTSTVTVCGASGRPLTVNI